VNGISTWPVAVSEGVPRFWLDPLFGQITYWPPEAAASFCTASGENRLCPDRLSSSTVSAPPEVELDELELEELEELLEELDELLLEEELEELLLEDELELLEELDELLLEEELDELLLELEVLGGGGSTTTLLQDGAVKLPV
jgi:hypothetical protein